MKIIIIGGGIVGLSTYLHLRKHLPHTHTITIYESHTPRSKLPASMLSTDVNLETLSESTAIVGGGLGVSPNGMRILRDLDIGLHDAVVAQGFPVEDFVFKGANGWTLGVQKTSDKRFKSEGEGEEVCVASSRHGLWETIMKSVGEGVVKYRKVVSIERNEDSGKTTIHLTDTDGNQETDEADLLIGADGVKSIVRTTLFPGDKFKPTYTGLSGVGGFLSTPIPPSILKPPSMVFTFGRNGFFGYSSGAPPSSGSLMWWSTFETAAQPSTAPIDRAAIRAALQKRHSTWSDPIIHDITATAEVESIYPTWVLDELPHWGEKGIVLVGDAAHAMDPTTGQGASQALEDSRTLALLLEEVLKEGSTRPSIALTPREKINIAIKLFYEVRSPRVYEIVQRGKKLAGRKADVGVVVEYFMYAFFWMLNTFPRFGKALIGDVNRTLYTWSAEEEIRKAWERYDAV